MKNRKWKRIASMAMAFVMTLSCWSGTGLSVKAAAPEGVTAQFGTPKIDGVVDEIWESATAYTLDQPNALSDTSAEAKVMWDDNALYVLVKVLDDNLNATAANAYEQDSVEVFLDELYDKATSYQSDDVHYRVNYQNKRSVDNGDLGRFYSATAEFEEEVAGENEAGDLDIVSVSKTVKLEEFKTKADEEILVKELVFEEPAATEEPEPVATEEPTQEPAATEAPTQEPAATEAPTQEPVATEAPTQEPVATETPTQEPVATEEPTQEPAATEEPTADPTATEAPTADPTATEEPTEEPEATEEPGTVEKGYYVEVCVRFENIVPANGTELGFDAQVNACQSGSRSGTISIFDATGNAWSNPSLFGKLVLQGKGEGDVSGPFPYSLITYLEEVKAMDLSIYTEETAAALTAEIEAAEALLNSGEYTQEQLDEAYEAIILAIKGLDDGSGYENPANLPEVTEIPDIFTFADGETAVTAENWKERAAEIKNLYEYYMYGPMPDTSSEVVSYSIGELTETTKEITLVDGTKTTVAARTGEMTVTVSENDVSSSFKVLVALPTTEAPEGGYPVFTELSASMSFGGWWTIPVSTSDNGYYAVSRGYASFTYDANEVAADDSSRTGAFYTVHPYGKSWEEQTGALVAWAWGNGKILDALENGAAADLNINAENNILGGVSRYGKATAVAGAYDDRIKVVVPSCSGAGGMAMYRHVSTGKTFDLSEFGYVNDEGTATHTVGDNEHLGSLQSNDEGHWFNDNFKKFESVQQFPMDQHFLASLVADPDRHLFIVNGVIGEDWTNPEAMSLTYAAAKEVYDMLGIGDQIRLSVHLEGHSINMSDMVALLDYCDVNLYGKNTADIQTDLRDVRTSVFLNQDNYTKEVFGDYVTDDLTDVDEESLAGLKFAVPCNSTYEVIKQNLPETVDIYVDEIRRIDAPVTWDVENCGYDPESKDTQELTVNGTVSLPEGIQNPENISLAVQASVIVTNLISYGSDIVDGIVGADYEQAESYKAETVLGSAAETVTTTDGIADITYMWDEAFFYVLADVTDSDVYVANGKGEQEDSISLTIAKNLTTGKDVQNYCMTAGGKAYKVDIDTSGWTAAKTYTEVDGLYADAELTEDGYRIEACFTWDTLGITPAETQVMAMETIVNSCSTATAGQDFMRAVGLTEYPENIETYSWWGFIDVEYNAGLYADDLTAYSLDKKSVTTVAEDIGRYSLIKYADSFYDNYVKPFPLQGSYDEQKVIDARAYALLPEATKEGIAEHRQILEDMAQALVDENYNGKMMTRRGTPVVDGKADDALWENAYPYKTNVAADGQYAEIRTLWDDEAAYALVKVFDPTFDVTGSDAHTKDSVEFFFLTPEDAAENSFGKNGGQWRINRANQVTVTFGMNEPFYAKATEMEDGTGYIVEARLDFADGWDFEHESVMNFDVAVNLCANGNRTEAVAWTSSDCYNNPSTAGQMIYLDNAAGESVVEAGYNPYALIKVLDKALVMEAEDYDAADFAEHYDKALLQKYYDEAIAGKLSAEQIDSYYNNVINMMSQITYDGKHKSALGFEADHDLPDPFIMADGSVVNSEESWEARHEEIQDLYEFYMYGKLPVAEETGLTKSFAVDVEDSSTYVVTLTRGDVQKSFSFKAYIPEGEEVPEGGWPYIINYGGNISGAQAAGYAVIDYSSNGDVASASSLYTGVFYDLYPECRGDNYATGVGHLAARAWGAGLIIDCIEAATGDLSKLDPEKSAVTGFSYLGKTALVTGVLEDRIAVTNPAHSGIGGAALLRYTSQGKKYLKSEYPMDMEEEYFLTTKTEPIGQAQGQGALWVKSIFADFIGSDSTPFDTHMLLSLVAPRGLFVSSGYFDNGTDPEGMYGAYLGAKKVYQFLNAEGNIVYADFPTSHTTSDDETQAFLQYLDYYFYGTELPEGFRDTVYDNSPDKAEYDVIQVPVKQADILDKIEALEDQIEVDSPDKTQTANEVLDILKNMGSAGHIGVITKADLEKAESLLMEALGISMNYVKNGDSVPTVEAIIGAIINGQAGDAFELVLSALATEDKPLIGNQYNEKTAAFFDMKLLKNNETVTLVTPATIRMQVPAGINANNSVKVLYYEDGAMVPVVLDATVVNGLLEFEVSGFGKFVVVNEKWQDVKEGLYVMPVEDQTYTGKAIRPVVEVYDGGVLLNAGTDYTVSYKNNTKPNDASNASTAPTVTVTGNGNYKGTETVTFKILKKDISDADITASDITVAYNKKSQKKVPVVTRNGKKLVNKTDFTVSYPDLANNSKAYKAPGEYTILVKGKDGYTGEREVKLTITESKLMSKVTVSKIATQPYTGVAVTTDTMNKAPIVKYGKSTVLKEGIHYTVEYSNNTNIGTATMILTGTDTETPEGTFTGTKKVTFKIGGTSLKGAVVTGVPKTMTYTGQEINEQTEGWGAPIKVVLKGEELTRAADENAEGDYIVTFKKNVGKGTASVTIKGINAYSGSVKKEFTIQAYNINDNTKKNLVTETMETVAFYAKDGSKPEPVVKFGETILVKGTDYTLKYKNHTKLNDGSNPNKLPTVTIIGKGNFKGTVKLTYTIERQDISKLSMKLVDKAFSFKQNAYKSVPKVYDLDGKALSSKDFTNVKYTYAENAKLVDGTSRNAGEEIGINEFPKAGTKINVTVEGKGNYKGTLTGTYRISTYNLSKAKVTIADQTYTGEAITLDKGDITVKMGDAIFSSDSYEIVSYKNNVKAGKAKVVLQGKGDADNGDLAGSKTVTFKIKQKGFFWWWNK